MRYIVKRKMNKRTGNQDWAIYDLKKLNYPYSFREHKAMAQAFCKQLNQEEWKKIIGKLKKIKK